MSFSHKQTSTILEQELVWQFGVWLCSPFSFSLGLATHRKCYLNVQLPGVSLASVEVPLTDLKKCLQTENSQTNSRAYRVAPSTNNTEANYESY